MFLSRVPDRIARGSHFFFFFFFVSTECWYIPCPPTVNYYATVPAPPTIVELSDRLYDKYEASIFRLRDLFTWGTAESDIGGITEEGDGDASEILGCDLRAVRFPSSRDWIGRYGFRMGIILCREKLF